MCEINVVFKVRNADMLNVLARALMATPTEVEIAKKREELEKLVAEKMQLIEEIDKLKEERRKLEREIEDLKIAKEYGG